MLGPLVRSRWLHHLHPPSRSPCGEVCLLCSSHEPLKFLPSSTFGPSRRDGDGTMACADPWRLSRPFQDGLPISWPGDRSPQIRTLAIPLDCPPRTVRIPARFTAPPFDGQDFVVPCRFVRAHGLISGSYPLEPGDQGSSGHGFASGFLQPAPGGQAGDPASRRRLLARAPRTGLPLATVGAITSGKDFHLPSQRSCWAYKGNRGHLSLGSSLSQDDAGLHSLA